MTILVVYGTGANERYVPAVDLYMHKWGEGIFICKYISTLSKCCKLIAYIDYANSHCGSKHRGTLLKHTYNSYET